MKRVVVFLLPALLAANFLQAQKRQVIRKNKKGWHKIGDAKVDFKTDNDIFILVGKDKFKSLQVKANDARVIIENITVEYKGNVKEELALASAFKTATESNIFELQHSNTGIRNVTFIYRILPNSVINEADIELWGLK